MNVENLIIMLLIGAVAGWLAGSIMKGRGFGIIVNMVVGIIGAVVGGFIFSSLGISAGGGIVGSLVVSTIGAIALLGIVGILKKL